MSVLEEIRSLESQVLARLRELEPSVAEYKELRHVAERLALDYKPNGGSASPAPPKRSSSRAGRKVSERPARRQAAAKRPRRKPVNAEQRSEQVMRVIADKPAITVPQLGKELKVDYTGLYRVVRRLVADGRVRKAGSELHPA